MSNFNRKAFRKALRKEAVKAEKARRGELPRTETEALINALLFAREARIAPIYDMVCSNRIIWGK